MPVSPNQTSQPKLDPPHPTSLRQRLQRRGIVRSAHLGNWKLTITALRAPLGGFIWIGCVIALATMASHFFQHVPWWQVFAYEVAAIVCGGASQVALGGLFGKSRDERFTWRERRLYTRMSVFLKAMSDPDGKQKAIIADEAYEHGPAFDTWVSLPMENVEEAHALAAMAEDLHKKRLSDVDPTCDNCGCVAAGRCETCQGWVCEHCMKPHYKDDHAVFLPDVGYIMVVKEKAGGAVEVTK